MRQVFIPRAVTPPSSNVNRSGLAILRLGGLTMGTSWSVKIAAAPFSDLRAIEDGIHKELDRVVSQMSTWEGTSTISRYNREPAGSWHCIEHEFFEVLTAALEIAESTGGAFDPALGDAVGLWGFGAQTVNAQVPPAARAKACLTGHRWQRIVLDRDRHRIFQPGGLQLDLSSIAKGFAVDQVAGYLASKQINDFLVEIGGELYGAGHKPDGLPWWVALEVPEDTSRPSEAVIALHGLAIATSGDYRRRITIGDTSYSHTIDPRTGMPVMSALASVSVAADTCMMADGIATALFVLGPDAGHAFAASRGIAARFMVRTSAGYRELLTPALRDMLA